MSMIRYFIVLVAIMLTTFPAPLLSNNVGVEHLDSLINEALNSNPQILATHSSWKAEEHKITQKRTLPDPMAMYGYYGESVQTRVGPMEHKVGAAQKIPFPSKLVFRGRSQKASAQIFNEDYEATKREIIKDIKSTYYDLFWVDKAIQITEGEKAILENLESVARRRYESNKAPQQDVIKAQVGISELIDKLYNLRESRKSLVARMNSLLNRPMYSPFGRILAVSVERFDHSLSGLHEMAAESRQELKGAELAIGKAGHEKTLAKLDYVPDFTFGFDYTFIGKGTTTMPNDGKDAWIGTVAINIPIWFNRLNANVKEKKAAYKAAQENYENTKNMVSYEVESLYYKLVSDKDTIDLYKTALIPQTEQAFDAAKIGYESGEVDFLNWLDAEKTLLQTKLTYYKAIADYQIAIALLERVVGQDL